MQRSCGFLWRLQSAYSFCWKV